MKLTKLQRAIIKTIRKYENETDEYCPICWYMQEHCQRCLVSINHYPCGDDRSYYRIYSWDTGHEKIIVGLMTLLPRKFWPYTRWELIAMLGGNNES